MDFARPLHTVTPTLDGDVLAVLAGADAELSGRRVHQLVGHSSEQGVRKTLDRLVEQGIASSRRAGQAKLYQLNRDHLAARHIEGLAALRSELLQRLRETVKQWKVEPVAALLFGSVARREAGAQSDLDLLVIRPARCDADAKPWRDQVSRLQQAATAWTGNDSRVLEFGEEELREGLGEREPVLVDAVKDGIEIAGSLRQLRRLIGARGPQPRGLGAVEGAARWE